MSEDPCSFEELDDLLRRKSLGEVLPQSARDILAAWDTSPQLRLRKALLSAGHTRAAREEQTHLRKEWKSTLEADALRLELSAYTGDHETIEDLVETASWLGAFHLQGLHGFQSVETLARKLWMERHSHSLTDTLAFHALTR